MSGVGAFAVAVAGAALDLSMVWRNNPAGVYEQGRYRQGLIRNLGDLIAPPYEKNRHGVQSGIQIRTWPFGERIFSERRQLRLRRIEDPVGRYFSLYSKEKEGD